VSAFKLSTQTPSEEDSKRERRYSLSRTKVALLAPKDVKPLSSTGQVPVSDEQFKEGKFPIRIRVRWENQKRHLFDEIHDYYLVCTTVGNGKSYTLIPAGTVTRKDPK
jgi:hypothetical protein